jgi:hypothetical protein
MSTVQRASSRTSRSRPISGAVRDIAQIAERAHARGECSELALATDELTHRPIEGGGEGEAARREPRLQSPEHPFTRGERHEGGPIE